MGNNAFGEESAFNMASRFEVLPIEEQVAENLPNEREEEVIKHLSVESRLRINHSPTVERIMGIYLEKEGKTRMLRQTIGDSGSPYLIEKLAPALYVTDQATYRTWGEGGMGISDHGPSAAASLLISKLVVGAPEFSPEVKRWAQRYLTHSYSGAILTARQFVEVNQEALKSHQFDKVIVPPGPPFYPVPTEEAAERATQSDKKPPRDRAVTAEVIAPKRSETARSHWWLVGLLLAIVLSFFIVKKKA